MNTFIFPAPWDSFFGPLALETALVIAVALLLDWRVGRPSLRRTFWPGSGQRSVAEARPCSNNLRLGATTQTVVGSPLGLQTGSVPPANHLRPSASICGKKNLATLSGDR